MINIFIIKERIIYYILSLLLVIRNFLNWHETWSLHIKLRIQIIILRTKFLLLPKSFYIFSLGREPRYLVLNSLSILDLNMWNLRIVWIIVNILRAIDAIALERPLLIVVCLSLLNLLIKTLKLIYLTEILTELILKSRNHLIGFLSLISIALKKLIIIF